MGTVITDKRTFYLVGIKGGGMTALAQLLQAMGKQVSGSDTTEKFFTDAVLQRVGIPYREGFAATNLPADCDAVIYSTAYHPAVHPELTAARERQLPLISYPQALGELISTRRTIAVAGTHGKTTTTAWLAWLLKESGQDPSAIIGSNVPQFGGNALAGASDLLVVETDEYQNKFLLYEPRFVVLTSVEWDHPDFFTTESAYVDAFANYIGKLTDQGWLLANGDDANIKKILPGLKTTVLTYGFDDGVDWQIRNWRIEDGLTRFDLFHQQKLWQTLATALPGRFNSLNAVAATVAAHLLGVAADQLVSSLPRFTGTERRFELKGTYGGARVYDDFAHHPGEIRATLKMAREYFPQQRIVVAFHPHTYTRTERLFEEFAGSFTDADEVIVLDIYASAREARGEVSSEKLVKAINAVSHNARYLADIPAATAYLKNRLDDTCVLITMGAGDVWRIGEALVGK